MASQWYLLRDGKEHGPYTSEQLKKLAATGDLEPYDLIRRNDMQRRIEAHTVKGLFSDKQPVPAVPFPRFPVPKAPPPTPPPPLSQPVEVEPIEDQPTGAPPPKWYKQDLLKLWWVRAGIGVVVLLVAVLRTAFWASKPSPEGSGSGSGYSQPVGGTITFAEYVDPRTLKTRNEGTRFTMGQVWWVVRGRKPFGDTKLITYGRIHGTEAWAVLAEDVVDPSWDTAVTKDILDVPGMFDVKVVTGKGEFVAQSTVEIVGR